ncbi:cysteine peptidase family C39 domain-containing protein [Companilactobacillus crustorum]|uniref:cysteine peptidase family C39 domain-containing protein n=1 Tax=Companilactobacillus crustorum TaxID=392416 RepID=UPI00096A79C7
MQKSKFTRFYTSQIDEKDCGIAALNMILKFYNSNYNLAHLRQLARTSRNGTTALGIVKAAQKLGFETLAIKTDISVFKRDNVSYPCIVHIIKKII